MRHEFFSPSCSILPQSPPHHSLYEVVLVSTQEGTHPSYTCPPHCAPPPPLYITDPGVCSPLSKFLNETVRVYCFYSTYQRKSPCSENRHVIIPFYDMRTLIQDGTHISIWSMYPYRLSGFTNPDSNHLCTPWDPILD